MKKAILFTACLAFTICSFAQTRPKAPATTPQEDTIQYALGVYMMQQLLAKTGFQITNTALFKKAIDDVAGNKKLMVDPSTTQARLLAYQDMYVRQKGVILEKKLFDQMKTQANYAKLPTGVMYTLVTVGNGPTPSLRDTVILNINSQLPDGTVIDDVSKTKQSYMALIAEMIPGLRDVVTKMKEGSICRAIIPASQAYGSTGTATIPPNSALIYDIALVSVKQAK